MVKDLWIGVFQAKCVSVGSVLIKVTSPTLIHRS